MSFQVAQLPSSHCASGAIVSEYNHTSIPSHISKTIRRASQNQVVTARSSLFSWTAYQWGSEGASCTRRQAVRATCPRGPAGAAWHSWEQSLLGAQLYATYRLQGVKRKMLDFAGKSYS